MPGAIGISDAGSGDAGARFAAALAAALSDAGVAVQLGLVAFGGLPAIDAPLADAFLALDLAPERFAVSDLAPALPPAPPDVVRVLAGLPALVAFAPALAIVVGAETAPARWPPALWALRGTYHLALSSPRPALPGKLASALVESRFLLGR